MTLKYRLRNSTAQIQESSGSIAQTVESLKIVSENLVEMLRGKEEEERKLNE